MTAEERDASTMLPRVTLEQVSLPKPPNVPGRTCFGCGKPVSDEEWIANPTRRFWRFDHGEILEIAEHSCGSTIARAVEL